MDWQQKWELWKTQAKDDALRKEAQAMNEAQAKECFLKDLEFGTGGMRGILGAGTNRMNVYTVRKTTKGFAEYIKAAGPEAARRGVALSHDNRRMSREFTMEAAGVLAAGGIPAYVFDSLRPTPELSFAVRELGCFGGIMITASHNPPQYNGYKLYDETGCQLVPDLSDKVTGFVRRVGNELEVESLPAGGDNGLIRTIGPELDEAYYKAVLDIQLDRGSDKSGLRVVFSPQHGTANVPVRTILSRLGYDLFVVEAQAYPDPDFSGTKCPNPENRAAFERAIELAREVRADIVITTDPDADRLGVAALHNGDYAYLTGNQSGAVLLEYILSQRKAKGTLPRNGIVIDTIVTSDLGGGVALKYGMATEKTLTGFKFIGDRIHAYEQSGEFSYIFGYEESYGYLISPVARDKDAVQAVLMACEAACFYKRWGKTLPDVLNGLYEEHGYFCEGQLSVELEGEKGSLRIAGIMKELRAAPPAKLAGLKVKAVEDYLPGFPSGGTKEPRMPLPKTDALKFILVDGSWAAARPSGTEPKLKFYFSARGKSAEEAEAKLAGMKEAFSVYK